MNKKLAITTILATGILGLVGVLNACSQPPQEETPTAMEFVCYDDGRLVERHHGVDNVSRELDSTMWHIEYTDGQLADYNQPSGESCQLEEAFGVTDNVQ